MKYTNYRYWNSRLETREVTPQGRRYWFTVGQWAKRIGKTPMWVRWLCFRGDLEAGFLQGTERPLLVREKRLS